MTLELLTKLILTSLTPNLHHNSCVQVSACCLIAVVELRGRKGLVRHCWHPDLSTPSILLEQEVMVQVTHSPNQTWELVTMAVCGRLKKLDLTQ